MPDLVIDYMDHRSCFNCPRNLGVAFGVAMSGGGVGGICIPLVITNLIQEEK